MKHVFYLGIQVWRVSWNVTGTILCSSGSDGVVLLWKSNYLGEWSLMSRVDTADSTISGTAGEPLMNR
jgi:nucleoporin SEH1